jgi:hypothetical protein
MVLAHLRSVLASEARHCRSGGVAPALTWASDGCTLVQAYRSDEDWRAAQGGNLDAPGLVPVGGLRDTVDGVSFHSGALRP